jgi:branched-chain amino acid transport system permease protein
MTAATERTEGAERAGRAGRVGRSLVWLSAGPRVVRSVVYGVIAYAILVGLANSLSDYRDFQLSEIAAYVVTVAGLTVLTGLNGQISLGHGALMAVGAYTTAVLLTHSHVPLVLVLVSSALAGAVFGVAVGVAAARLRGPYLAGATLAVAVGLPQIPKAYHYLGRDQGLTITPPTPPGWLGQNFSLQRWVADITLLGAVVVIVLLANLVRSRYGRNFRAVRDDEIAASLAGIPVARTQVLAFTVSAACAGLGGALLALVITTVSPGGFTLALSIQLLVAIVIGGIGSLGGAVIGAALLVYLPNWSASLSNGLGFSKTSGAGANLSLALFGALLIVVMLLFPGGLAGGLRRLYHRN